MDIENRQQSQHMQGLVAIDPGDPAGQPLHARVEGGSVRIVPSLTLEFQKRNLERYLRHHQINYAVPRSPR